MSPALKEKILESLGNIEDAERKENIVDLGMVSGLQIAENGDVVFAIEVDPQRGSQLEPLRQRAENAVAKISGVNNVTAVLTAQKIPSRSTAPPSSVEGGKTRTPSSHLDPHGMNKNPKLDLPIKHIIAVASGKGGVGKSTISSQIVSYLANNIQLSVGLLDADIYGPSQPRMMGLGGQKPEQIEGKIQPLRAHGVKVMSIGFMVDQSEALIWRGPMVQTAIYQLLRDVQWSDIEADGSEKPLDILIVDMPPGTGDAQLTMAQKVPVSGAIIVSTPQDIALIDARKAVQMFKKTSVPILGLIENMSTHICTNCGHEEHVFGHGGAKAEAQKIGVPFLGEVPLDIKIREASDRGRPANAVSDIAEALLTLIK